MHGSRYLQSTYSRPHSRKQAPLLLATEAKQATMNGKPFNSQRAASIRPSTVLPYKRSLLPIGKGDQLIDQNRVDRAHKVVRNTVKAFEVLGLATKKDLVYTGLRLQSWIFCNDMFDSVLNEYGKSMMDFRDDDTMGELIEKHRPNPNYEHVHADCKKFGFVSGDLLADTDTDEETDQAPIEVPTDSTFFDIYRMSHYGEMPYDQEAAGMHAIYEKVKMAAAEKALDISAVCGTIIPARSMTNKFIRAFDSAVPMCAIDNIVWSLEQVQRYYHYLMEQERIHRMPIINKEEMCYVMTFRLMDFTGVLNEMGISVPKQLCSMHPYAKKAIELFAAFGIYKGVAIEFRAFVNSVLDMQFLYIELKKYLEGWRMEYREDSDFCGQYVMGDIRCMETVKIALVNVEFMRRKTAYIEFMNVLVNLTRYEYNGVFETRDIEETDFTNDYASSGFYAHGEYLHKAFVNAVHKTDTTSRAALVNAVALYDITTAEKKLFRGETNVNVDVWISHAFDIYKGRDICAQRDSCKIFLKFRDNIMKWMPKWMPAQVGKITWGSFVKYAHESLLKVYHRAQQVTDRP